MTTLIQSTSTLKGTLFQDLRVDNEGFFDAVEDKLPEVLSAIEIHQQTRLDMKKLLSGMKKQRFIQGVTEWTADEQRNFFNKIKEEIVDTGVLFSSRLCQKIQNTIELELWREINDDGVKYSLQDGGGNTILSNVNDYQYFLKTSFLAEQETTIVPMNLHLTVDEDDSIEDAIAKIRRYGGKYNSLILVDKENHPIGIIRVDAIAIHWTKGNVTLRGIEYIPNTSGYYGTSRQDAEQIMKEYDINILPIVDSISGVLIGILTIDSLKRRETKYYSTVSLTELSLDYFKSKNI